MQLLQAVILDLYTFARDAIGSAFIRQPHPVPLPSSPREAKATDVIELEAPETHTRQAATPSVYAQKGYASTLEFSTEDVEEAPQKNTIMYTVDVRVPLYVRPGFGVDEVVREIPYGVMLMVLGSQNGWSHVAVGSEEGWVEARHLVDRAAHVYPQFTIGEQNGAQDENTLRVRAMINDEFAAGRAGLPLQAEEYVLYRLERDGKRLNWPDVRPRKPGYWHGILIGAADVTISSDPKAGSILEIIHPDGDGHVAYVEATFPDNSIQISEANWPDRGIYNERVLTRNEWTELKPTFIEVA